MLETLPRITAKGTLTCKLLMPFMTSINNAMV